MPQYCLVKHHILSSVIDGPDVGNEPDTLPISGDVTFYPILGHGDSVVVTAGAEKVSYVLAPISARIVKGKIFVNGEEGVKLFAGGPNSNPERIRYRAKFKGLNVYGGKSIELKDILFEAIPGGELTLSVAQPVPGAPYPGYSATIEQGIAQIEGARDEALGQVEEAVATEIGDIRSGLVPPTVENLWDYDVSTPQSMNVLGTPQDHARHRLSPFIPVVPGEYVSHHGLHRILFFTADYARIPGTDTAWLNGKQSWVAPSSAAYARMVIDPGDLDRRDAIFNRGNTLFDPENPNHPVSSGWWDDKELPPNPLAGELEELRAADVPPAQYIENLWDYSATTPQTMSILGTFSDHARHRLSPFLPVVGNEQYMSHHHELMNHRVIFFDSDHTYIPGTDTAWLKGTQSWVAPSSAAYARMVIDPGDLDRRDAIFNQGTELVEPGDPLVPIPSGWWGDRELPPVDEDSMEELRAADVPPAQYIENLWDYSATTPQSMNVLGTPQDHARHRLSPFIPVVPGEYVSHHGLHRILFFTADYARIPGTDTAWLNGKQSWVAPSSAAYARMVIDPGDLDRRDAIFNRGNTLFDPENPNHPVSSGWWDDKELPPNPLAGGGIGEGDLEQLRADLLSEVDGLVTVPHFEPSFPTLAFDPDWYVGWARPRWLSQDGLMLWGSRGFILEQSDDEWQTRQFIHEFPRGIEAVRETSDGELLVSIGRNEEADERSVIYRSTGYSRDNPTAATWDPVLSTISKQADFKSTWGLGVSGNIVTASEYGLRGVEGSRRGWLSEDHGSTWKLVFDQKTVVADGQPEWVDGRAHLHGITWDPYWNRLWALCGDNPSTALYYSDDKGDSWKFVPGSDEMQYTGCMPLPDTVLFGSDRTPNGLHVYRRGLLTDIPVVKPLLIVDDSLGTTKAFGLPFRRDQSPTSATYFPGPDAGYSTPSVITATVDGLKGHLLWEGQTPGSGLLLSGTVAEVLGPTAQGGIVATMAGDPTVTGVRVMRADAPTWQRV